MKYTLHQLIVFLKIVELESITKAAEDLYLSQPAVSIQLKNLQEQFDIPLTEVVGRKIFITDFGREIAKSARNILMEANKIEEKTAAYKGLLSGKLTFSIVSTGKYIMPYLLSDFSQKHPELGIQMDVTNRYKVLQSLEKNEVDFSLVSILPESLAVDAIALMPNYLYWITSAENNILHGAEIPPLIFREEGSATRIAMEDFLKNSSLGTSKKIELSSNEAVKQAVIAGLGVSLLPLIGIKNQLLEGSLKIVTQESLPIISTWHLVWLKGKQLSPAAQAYLAYIKTEKESLIEKHFGWIEAYRMGLP